MLYRILLNFIAGLLAVSLHAQNEDCKVKESDFVPIITRFNPFFTDHKWLDFTKQETARMDKNRILIISQDGCKRHHKVFTLYLKNGIAENTDSFWIRETISLFRSVYYQDKTFRSFQKEFEDLFEEKFLQTGVNQEFNFPVGTRNFICEVEVPDDPENDPVIRVNMIEFVFEEKVVEMRKSNAKDDGWFVSPASAPKTEVPAPVLNTPLPPPTVPKPGKGKK